jgi:uncharacterized phage protein gp47/JayE
MPFPLATLAAQVVPSGITAPSYADILSSLKASFKSIYGSDSYLEADSQDGQLLAVFAKAINDCNQMAIAVYQSFSPVMAQGVGLSSVVKINGITRLPATKSTVNVTLTGIVGTVINAGVVQDTAGNRWDLPATVTIPGGGVIVVTATAQVAGAVAAAIGTVTQIATPVAGWQSVNNTGIAVAGAALETDAALRIRQAQSVALPAQTVLSALLASVAAVVGVTASRVYENDTNAVDANGLPAHSIGIVAQGGVAADIAAAIMNKKSPGVLTFGTTTVNLIDQVGVSQSIKFTVPNQKRIMVTLNVHALTGYSTDVGIAIKTAVQAYINALGIGTSILYTRLYGPALLIGSASAGMFEIVSILISINPAAVAAADVAIAWNEIANSALADITLNLV